MGIFFFSKAGVQVAAYICEKRISRFRRLSFTSYLCLFFLLFILLISLPRFPSHFFSIMYFFFVRFLQFFFLPISIALITISPLLHSFVNLFFSLLSFSRYFFRTVIILIFRVIVLESPPVSILVLHEPLLLLSRFRFFELCNDVF